MRNDPVIFACDYQLKVPTLLFGSASGTTTSSSAAAATRLINQFSCGNVLHEAKLVAKPVSRASPKPRPPPGTTRSGL